MKTQEDQINPTFENLTASVPGCGRPISGGSPVPADLADANRALRKPTLFSPFLPRNPILQDAGPTFSASRFADELRNRLAGNAKGWAFAITTNGTLAEEAAGGQARTPADGLLAMAANKRLYVASVSKVIIAVAVLRLLEETSLTIEDRIWPFLPDHWTLGPGIATLHFRDLLQHTSGLTSTNSNFANTVSYEGLATAIENGGSSGSTYQYLNVNYALFRVIIPALWRGAGHPVSNNDNAIISALFYAVYIIEEIFGRMDGTIGPQASTSELDPNPTRYYGTVNSNTGVSFGNWALLAGGGGWHLSARELAGFLTYITYSNDILSQAARTQMDSLALGWRRLSQTVGMYGQYYARGGVIVSNGGRVRTAVAKFSIQCEASLVANSAITGFPDPVQVLIEAFDAAWA